MGRKGDLIISGGENVHPVEIEQLVATIPGVADCAVVGMPHERWGEVPVLAVVRVAGPAGAGLQALHIVSALAPRLARFKLPARVVFLASLPTTALGKVARAELRQRLAAMG